MKVKEAFIQFIFTFVITFVVTAAVTFLWSLIFHGTGVVDWETSFRFAIIFGVVFGIINKKNKYFFLKDLLNAIPIRYARIPKPGMEKIKFVGN